MHQRSLSNFSYAATSGTTTRSRKSFSPETVTRIVDGLYGGLERIQRILVMRLQVHLDEDVHGKAEAVRVEQHHAVTNEARGLEFLHAPPAGRVRRPTRSPSSAGHIAVGLERLEDAEIEVVEHGLHKIRIAVRSQRLPGG